MNMDDASESEDSVFRPDSPPEITLDEIRGLDEEVAEIKQDLIRSAAGDVPDELRTMTLLLYGKFGGGKRRVSRAIAGELEKHGYDSYQWVETVEQGRLADSQVIEELLEGAIEGGPTTLVLDCFDEYLMEDAVRVIGSRMKEARQQGEDVVLIGVIDEEEMYTESVRDFIQTVNASIEIEKPDIDRRRHILKNKFQDIEKEVDGFDPERYDLDRLAMETDRFGVSDIESVVRRSALSAFVDTEEMEVPGESEISEIVKDVNDERLERIVDEKTLMGVDVPEIKFDDIGGNESVKEKLVERVRQSLEHNDLADELDLDFGSGILLHGPPGTGKTMLVRALANELEYTFIPTNSARLKGGLSGGTEMIPTFFYRAQRNSPAILFFDEFDSIGIRRDSPIGDEAVVNTLLNELDGVEQLDEVVVIAATNRPEVLDPALLRPGRFDYHFEVDVPDQEAQMDIFRKQTSDIILSSDVTPEWFVEMTEKVTGADIASICERAVTISTRDQTDVDSSDVQLTQNDFRTAYKEFEDGRLNRRDLDSSPAFR